MPSFHSTACALLTAGQLAAAAIYTLQDNYDKANFFEEFEFFSDADPTNGFVQYQDATSASSLGLAGYNEDAIYLGADHTTKNPANGRASTRVYSKKTYTQMLLVADVVHMPVGCGTWPALWSYGGDWPTQGEIDIIEGVNSQSSNEITLHTDGACTMTRGRSSASTKFAATADCSAGDGSTGCPQKTESKNNFGRGLNAGGGGIYAMLWDHEAISVYLFPRNSSMADTLSGGGDSNNTILGSSSAVSAAEVDTSGFGTPLATFVGGEGCDIAERFRQHAITVNTDFCGSWAGSDEVWAADDECSARADTCEEYVAGNPDAFVDAYWLLNSIKVYTTSGAGAAATATATATATGSAALAGETGVFGVDGKRRRGMPFIA